MALVGVRAWDGMRRDSVDEPEEEYKITRAFGFYSGKKIAASCGACRYWEALVRVS
jgi:hypothetical protein